MAVVLVRKVRFSLLLSDAASGRSFVVAYRLDLSRPDGSAHQAAHREAFLDALHVLSAEGVPPDGVVFEVTRRAELKTHEGRTVDYGVGVASYGYPEALDIVAGNAAVLLPGGSAEVGDFAADLFGRSPSPDHLGGAC